MPIPDFQSFMQSMLAFAADGEEHSSAQAREARAEAFQTIRSELASDLRLRLQGSSPRFFETLVVELLLKMGYGRNRADPGRALAHSCDEGNDCITSEDRLGLDTIYIQAKRWTGMIGRPELQRLSGYARWQTGPLGIILTTGAFPP
jgi:restriction system protein